ncbi:MAG: type VII toxin-antitoxin system HepT family RNase toxin [Candidatus Hodarchaeales archaeon]|jgi:uncharacterized protein YutE (UPF0331/DUF86 family)
MPVNKIRILEKFATADKYIEITKNVLKNSFIDFKDRYDLQLQGERLFEIISQIILDTCTHIVSHSKIGAPKHYSDCLRKLTELGIIPGEKIEKFIDLIKMRNLLVHQYNSIDYQLLYDALNSLSQDFQYYKSCILTWLQTQNLDK